MSARDRKGVLFIVSAPSGAGKTSLVKALLGRDDHLGVSVSHTTRTKRHTEADGINYHFVTRERFEAMVQAGAFLEHAEVFGNSYGTATTSVEAKFAAGVDVILEIDWQGAAQVRQRRPDAVSIFILPPSLEALRSRLTQRGEDAAEEMERRLTEARNEISHCGEFDYLVVNDEFGAALNQLQGIVTAERCRRRIAEPALEGLLGDLLKGS